jgi:hypothetical protein
MNPLALVFDSSGSMDFWMRKSTAYFLETSEVKIGISWLLAVRKTGYCSNIGHRILG